MDLIKQIDETFKFENKEIRVFGSYNEPCFVAKDICDILELSNITNALRNIPEKWMTLQNVKSSYNSQNMIMLSEPAVYKLIMRSNKPVAQKFQEVVCGEILPSLRKKGEYQVQSILDKNKELENKNKELEAENKEYSNRRKYKIGECVYIVMSEHIKEEFKVGQSDDIHRRMKEFNNASPTKFILHKIWYTRFNKILERLVQELFEKYRISLNNEWFKIECLDKITDYIDNFIELSDKNDTKEIESSPAPNLIFIDNNRTDKKKCSRCLLAKPLYKFYFRDENIREEDFDLTNEEQNETYKNKKYRSNCKICYNKYAKELRIKIKENQNYNKKECLDCKNMLTYENFYKINDKEMYDTCVLCYNKKNGLVNSKQCTDCSLILPVEKFGIHTDASLRSQCKNCRNKKIKEVETEVTCEFCNKKIKHKNNLRAHQKTNLCLKAQGKTISSEKNKSSVNIRSRIVLQYDIATQTEIKRYKSVAEATKETNIERTSIENCCNGKNKTAGGYIFKFMS